MTETKKEGTAFAVGDWVRYAGNVGEVVEVRPGEGGTEEYVVRSPEARVDASPRHIVPGDALTPSRVEDSHLFMAVDHLEYVREELFAAGLREDAETASAFLATLYARAEGDGCSGCGSFTHPDGSCLEEEE